MENTKITPAGFRINSKEEKEKLLKERNEFDYDLEHIKRSINRPMMPLQVVALYNDEYKYLQNSEEYERHLMKYIKERIQNIDNKLGI